MYAVLPALKRASQIILNSEAGSVVHVFPFQHVLMADSLSVSWSPATGTCAGTVLGMCVIVSCLGLMDIQYTVTIGITLIVNGELLPVSFSESFTPTYPSLLSSTSGLWLRCYAEMSCVHVYRICSRKLSSGKISPKLL